MTDEEQKALADDITNSGLLQPVTIHEGKILDGVNRATACEKTGVKLRTELLADGVDPVAFVVAQNIHRRQLSATQRAVIAAKLMPHFAAEAAARKRALSGTRSNPDGSTPEVAENLPEPAEQGEAREKAAAAAGANPRYVSDVVRLQREAPELFQAVETGYMSIPKALKKLEDKEENSPDETSGITRNAFIAVLWDDSMGDDSGSNRAPEKTYNSKLYPNIAFFRFYPAGVCEFGQGQRHGMTQVALFAVPGQPGQPVKDKNGTPLCKANCHFLTLSVRGSVLEPEVLPDQIIGDCHDAGYDAVVKVIASMWPTALKVVSTMRSEAPKGWQLVPRQSASKQSSQANEEQPAKQSSTAAAPLQGVPKTEKEKAKQSQRSQTATTHRPNRG